MVRGPLRTALVTGGARRIGRAIALALAERGYAVAIHYRASATEATELVTRIRAAGGRAETFPADLRDETATRALVADAAAALGEVVCLVNNASAFERDNPETVQRTVWDLHMEVNLRAPLVLAQAFAARLPDGVEGNIVNVIDQRVLNPTPFFTSYTLSKAALWTLTRTLALAWAPRIRVNAVGPGPTLPSPRQTEEHFVRQWATVPMRRPTAPEDIGRAVLHILDLPTMTGQMIVLDGGQHLGRARSPRAGPVDE